MNKELIRKIFRRFGYEINRVSRNKEPLTENGSNNNEGDDFARLRDEFCNYPIKNIHFGCGPRVLKGWINIDLSYEPYEKYLTSYGDKYYPQEIRGERSDLFAFDITKCGLPIPDNSVDVIFHEDFLEHLNQRDQIIFLSETLRTLKKGGVHHINTPDLLSTMREHSNFRKGLAGVYVDEWDRWHHINIFTPESLSEIALMTGYSSVIFNIRDKSIINTQLPLEYRPSSDRPEDGNIFADLVK